MIASHSQFVCFSMAFERVKGDSDLTYFGEFRRYWPNLLGACVGLALGSALNHYLMNLFAPALIEEFGWSKAQFALVGSLGIGALLLVPVAGRIVDKYGPRVGAMIGFSVVPLGYFALSLMTGNIFELYGILLIQNIFGVLTTGLVFSRVIVERFDAARGLALSLLMTGAPLVGAIAVPLLGGVIEAEGWRTAYRIMAGVSASGGLFAILLIGRGSVRATVEPPKLSWAEFSRLMKHRVFALMLIGMFLVNVPQVLVSGQLSLMLMDNGASAKFAAWLVSGYAISIVIGRFICGLALDRIGAHVVAAFSLGLPALGLAALAGPVDAQWLLICAVALIGLAQGAEGDIGAFMASRHFEISNFSLVYGFLISTMSLASVLCSLLLSATLKLTGNFDLFLIISAMATLIGAFALYWTGRLKGQPQ